MNHYRIALNFEDGVTRFVDCGANEKVLDAAFRNRINLPMDCSDGVCGTCKCRIERGLEHTDEVKAKERKHLNDEQLADGYRMACQTFIRGDIAVSW